MAGTEQQLSLATVCTVIAQGIKQKKKPAVTYLPQKLLHPCSHDPNEQFNNSHAIPPQHLLPNRRPQVAKERTAPLQSATSPQANSLTLFLHCNNSRQRAGKYYQGCDMSMGHIVRIFFPGDRSEVRTMPNTPKYSAINAKETPVSSSHADTSFHTLFKHNPQTGMMLIPILACI